MYNRLERIVLMCHFIHNDEYRLIREQEIRNISGRFKQPQNSGIERLQYRAGYV